MLMKARTPDIQIYPAYAAVLLTKADTCPITPWPDHDDAFYDRIEYVSRSIVERQT